MIISRAPLRISLGGGGTDLPSYYREHGGFVLSAAIDKYVYITLHETFQQEYLINNVDLKWCRPSNRSSTPSSAKLCVWCRWPRRNLEVVSMAIFRRAPGWGRAAVSRWRCCARCTP